MHSTKMMKFTLLLGLTLCISPVYALQAVATIKPLHSLVQSILGDSATAELLLDSSASPHEVQLKPSDIRTLNKADVVFMIDRSFEGFMVSVLDSIPDGLSVVEMGQDEAVERLPPRSLDQHEHGHGHHGDIDPHMWLDPINAKLITRAIAGQLAKLDESNSALYQQNLLKTLERLDALDEVLSARLAGFQSQAFITQHDAYQYFDRRYGLNFISSIALDSAVPASVKQALKIQSTIEAQQVKCIYQEPQFSDRLATTIAESTGIKIGILDPIGVNLTPGPDLYFELMRNLADNFTQCMTSEP